MRSYVLVIFGSELSNSLCKKGNAISDRICNVHEIKTNWLLSRSQAISGDIITISRVNECYWSLRKIGRPLEPLAILTANTTESNHEAVSSQCSEALQENCFYRGERHNQLMMWLNFQNIQNFLKLPETK